MFKLCTGLYVYFNIKLCWTCSHFLHKIYSDGQNFLKFMKAGRSKNFQTNKNSRDLQKLGSPFSPLVKAPLKDPPMRISPSWRSSRARSLTGMGCRYTWKLLLSLRVTGRVRTSSSEKRNTCSLWNTRIKRQRWNFHCVRREMRKMKMLVPTKPLLERSSPWHSRVLHLSRRGSRCLSSRNSSLFM